MANISIHTKLQMCASIKIYFPPKKTVLFFKSPIALAILKIIASFESFYERREHKSFSAMLATSSINDIRSTHKHTWSAHFYFLNTHLDCVCIVDDLVFRLSDKWWTNASYGRSFIVYAFFSLEIFQLSSFNYVSCCVTLFLFLFPSFARSFERNSDTTADLTVQCMSVCCHPCNADLTMMFLWLFSAKRIQ